MIGFTTMQILSLMLLLWPIAFIVIGLFAMLYTIVQRCLVGDISIAHVKGLQNCRAREREARVLARQLQEKTFHLDDIVNQQGISLKRLTLARSEVAELTKQKEELEKDLASFDRSLREARSELAKENIRSTNMELKLESYGPVNAMLKERENQAIKLHREADLAANIATRAHDKAKSALAQETKRVEELREKLREHEMTVKNTRLTEQVALAQQGELKKALETAKSAEEKARRELAIQTETAGFLRGEFVSVEKKYNDEIAAARREIEAASVNSSDLENRVRAYGMLLKDAHKKRKEMARNRKTMVRDWKSKQEKLAAQETDRKKTASDLGTTQAALAAAKADLITLKSELQVEREERATEKASQEAERNRLGATLSSVRFQLHKESELRKGAEHNTARVRNEAQAHVESMRQKFEAESQRIVGQERQAAEVQRQELSKQLELTNQALSQLNADHTLQQQMSGIEIALVEQQLNEEIGKTVKLENDLKAEIEKSVKLEGDLEAANFELAVIKFCATHPASEEAPLQGQENSVMPDRDDAEGEAGDTDGLGDLEALIERLALEGAGTDIAAQGVGGIDVLGREQETQGTVEGSAHDAVHVQEGNVDPAQVNQGQIDPQLLGPALFNDHLSDPQLLDPAHINQGQTDLHLLDLAMIDELLSDPQLVDPALLEGNSTTDEPHQP